MTGPVPHVNERAPAEKGVVRPFLCSVVHPSSGADLASWEKYKGSPPGSPSPSLLFFHHAPMGLRFIQMAGQWWVLRPWRVKSPPLKVLGAKLRFTSQPEHRESRGDPIREQSMLLDQNAHVPTRFLK